jgi:hypothetical protein
MQFTATTDSEVTTNAPLALILRRPANRPNPKGTSSAALPLIHRHLLDAAAKPTPGSAAAAADRTGPQC